jgi:tetratricopeptide (TPR) repeat protein
VRSKLLKAIFVIFLMIGSALTHAQDKPAPPQESVSKVIALYKTQGNALTVSIPEDAKEYIELFGGLESLSYDINSLDQQTRKTLSVIYNNYALSFLKYNNRNPSANDIKKAEEMYLKAVELDPKDTDIIENLAILYYKHKKDYRNAIKYYNMSLDLDPSDAGIKGLRDAAIEKMNE